MSKHTPGPWTYRMHKLGGFVDGTDVGGRSKRIARVSICKERMFVGEAEANTRIIAAAPDLLAACKAAREKLKMDGHWPGVYEALDAAIAKAEGGAA